MLKSCLSAVLLTCLASGQLLAGETLPPIRLYSPKVCLACIDYADYLRQHGFAVSVETPEEMALIKRRMKVPRALEAQPTAVVAGYFIEGHVPAEDIKALLLEKPRARGLAVPGLPQGAPGREYTNPTCDTGCTVLDQGSGEQRVRRELYETLLVKPNGDSSIFARH